MYFRCSGQADVQLGSVQSWPAASALLLLDSFELTQRAQILVQASNHCGVVWVLRRDQHSVSAASECFGLTISMALLHPKSIGFTSDVMLAGLALGF